MATRYCNLAGAWTLAQTGADNTGNEWLGVAGLQKAFDTVGTDDIVYVTGYGDLGRLVTLTVNDTTGWAPGDDLQNNNLGGGAAGDDWSGAVLYEVTDGTHIIMEMQSGETIDDIDLADGVDNTTQADQETCSVKTVVGIQADGTDGASTNEIFFICVNAAWSEDGTKATLDGSSAATKATQCLYVNGVDYYQFRNFRFTDASGDGMDSNTAAAQDNLVFINCDFDTNGGSGAGVEEMEYAHFYRCRFYLNTSHGVDSPHLSSRFVACSSFNNTGNGYSSSNDTDRVSFIHCISHNNSGEYGFKLDVECETIHCLVDGESAGIRHSGAIGGLSVFSRITNCTSYGLSCNNGHRAAWNLFYNNTLDGYFTASATLMYLDGADTNLYDPDADDGYNDRANDDFNLKDSRTYTGETEYIDLGIGS